MGFHPIPHQNLFREKGFGFQKAFEWILSLLQREIKMKASIKLFGRLGTLFPEKGFQKKNKL